LVRSKVPTIYQRLADAIFHYLPWVTKCERFEVCIATEEMKEAAWKYTYKS